MSLLRHIFGARPSDFRPSLLAGAAGVSGLPAPAASVDQRRWCSFVSSQSGERCVGEAYAGASFVANGNQGQRFSDLCIWTQARAREIARKGAPLLDQGVDPADAVDGMIASGVCARGADDEDPDRDTGGLYVEEVVSAYKHRFSASNFMALGDGDVATGQQVLTLGASQTAGGIVIPFCMQVDSSYEDLTSTNPVWTGPSGAIAGGHCQCWVGYTRVAGKDCAIIWNSWSTSFADGGFAYIPLDTFAEVATSLVAVLSAPVIQ